MTSLSARLARTCTFGRHVVATTFACSASVTPREAANARRNGSFHEAQMVFPVYAKCGVVDKKPQAYSIG